MFETTVTVCQDKEKKKITVMKGEPLMEALLREGQMFNGVCAGSGRCGKCGIRVIRGDTPITKRDREVFTEQQLMEGFRLSCLLYPKEELTITLTCEEEREFSILAEGGYVNADQSNAARQTMRDTDFGVAVDIGTTTIVLALFGIGSRCLYGTASMLNRQRRFGLDVISRIKAASEGSAELMKESVREDLGEGIQKLTGDAGIHPDQVIRMVIGGNATMGHLLMGYDCASLGRYPFTPVNISTITGTAGEILGQFGWKAQVLLLPGISTYVGGDIVAGLLACGFDRVDEISLFLDLGTNGEMALGNREKILVTSTAAGPVFEGGNITWGTGSVAGAICSVQIDGVAVKNTTIGGQAPEGICGTGVIEAVAELLKEGLIEESGLLDESYFDQGFPLAETRDGRKILLTQRDIREVQLAKAAIRAGIETLIVRYGIKRHQVRRVYLAGGFGFHLDPYKAVVIGLLPEEFLNRIEVVGNSCLSGAAEYLLEQKKDCVEHILEVSEEIALAADPCFKEIYMESMVFESLWS